jgi:hypothetical protein
MNDSPEAMEKEISEIQKKLAKLGSMRPGTLGYQYRDRANKLGGYWQISYTHKRRSRSEHVKPQHVNTIKKELANFKLFRELTERWIDLSIEVSKAKRKRETDL